MNMSLEDKYLQLFYFSIVVVVSVDSILNVAFTIHTIIEKYLFFIFFVINH